MFDIEYVYRQPPHHFIYRHNATLAIDLGLDNFAACVTTDETAFILEGRGIKSFNRWWNKYKAGYQSKLKYQGLDWSNRLSRHQKYRENVIDNFLNHCVKEIISHCTSRGIGHIVVGDWGDMKRGQKLRKKTNQLFQMLPYKRFKHKLQSKAKLYNMQVTFIDESYTSQTCSRCAVIRKANRVHRGLYRCKLCGLKINADINGALNILYKVVPKVLFPKNQWNSGDIISPVRKQLVAFK